ncbi:MAG: cation-translocating P-type ATPase [Geobacteraceae bacterium]|nr:cation-translocating P-type ATPase [Geobacteraceae bacterium]
MNWHLMDIPAILEVQESDPGSGLSSEIAAIRLESTGFNELLDRGGKSPWLILWEQFTSTMALILTGAAIVSGFVGSLKDCLTIMAIVCLFALLGFFQEFRAERTMRALKKLAIPFVRVRRNGEAVDIPSVDLVPGDIVLLEAGNLVPADCRVLESYNLKIQESILTGEAEAVEKITAVLAENTATIGDQRNMAFMGTTVTYGRGVVIVVATGMQTELGKIATMLQNVVEEMTPLQKRLDHLGKVLAVIAFLISILYFMLGLMRGEELRLLLMTAVSLAVAAIPEGLPAVVTITLAIGSQRMLQRRALIRKLPAVETLGSVTVICSDKTGTLTENSMTVTDLHPIADCNDKLLLLAASLCNDAVLRVDEGSVVMLGDPTETALLVAAAKLDLLKPELEALFPRIEEIPFDSATKRMVTMHAVSSAGATHPMAAAYGLQPGDRLVIAKGAADVLLSYCGDSCSISGILADAEKLALQGKRVLACICSRLEPGQLFDLELISGNMKFAGLIAMMDPPRREAHAAVIKCLQAGIRPVMITGDHPLTASSIARSLEISDNDIVVTGDELDRIGPDGLAGIAGHVSVYARVSPAHKLLIVEALQMRGDVVAMTGDGVNDAPALKKADIGVSMGISGTDVAKEAADMVLMDDNFATIVSAVEEGRTIYDNICKFIEFSVAGNLGKIIAVMALPIMGLTSPLTPLQLLWLNLLTDGLLGLGLGVERPEPDIMRRTPISTTAQIFDRRMLRHILLTGGVIGLSSIGVAWHHWLHHPSDWQTALFTSLAFAQIGQAMALRSFNHSLFKVGFFSNPLLLGMCIAVILLQMLVVFLPSMQSFFNTTTIDLSSLIWIMAPGLLVFTTLEIEKALSKSKPAQQF